MAEIRSEGGNMNRETVISKGCLKAKQAIAKLEKSRDIDYTEERVKITNSLELEIVCIRDDAGQTGMPLEYEIYALKDGNAVDCCTVYLWEQADKDIMYLLNCYV